MIYIDDDLRKRIDHALADRCPMFIATVSPDGGPQISMRGSVLVFDRETLAFWERSWRVSAANIASNSQVVLFYRNPEQRINLRFYGTATLYQAGAIRENVMARTVPGELERDPERTGAAVLVRLYRINQLSGETLQEREPGA